MMNTTLKVGLRLVGCAVVSVAVLIKLMVVVLVTLSKLMDDTAIDVDANRYCDEVTEMLDVWDVVELPTIEETVDVSVGVDLSVMTWNELRTFAKSVGVTTLKSKKVVLEALQLLGHVSESSVYV